MEADDVEEESSKRRDARLSKYRRRGQFPGRNPLPSNGLERHNVLENRLRSDLEKRISKIKDEPTMLLNTSNLKIDKMPYATMLLKMKDLSVASASHSK
jgi:hypothetical protein